MSASSQARDGASVRSSRPRWPRSALQRTPDLRRTSRHIRSMPRPEICPKAKPVDAPCVFRSRRIRVVAWQGLCDLASALGEQQRHPADRPMSLERGATFPSVARPRWADPKPKYALSQPKCTYGSTSVQWFGPSLCEYAWAVTADVSSGETTGGIHR